MGSWELSNERIACDCDGMMSCEAAGFLCEDELGGEGARNTFLWYDGAG